MTILCLCGEDNHRKLLPGYARAFRDRGFKFFCVDWDLPFDCPIEQILRLCPEEPDLILHVESDFPLMPEGLVKTEIPTVCLQVDTYAYTERRIRWSMLFDHVGVFHPGYEGLFRDAGHDGAFVLPHAVRRDFFDRPEIPRDFEVGWVGQTSGSFYRKREEWIPKLSKSFRMNDWTRSYSLEEVAEVYRRSRVVVNFGRDDFARDANLRVFEVLASGALLVTSLPNEICDLGFQEGVHFVGYREEDEIIPLVQSLLQYESARLHIAQAARTKILQEHTYDSRVETLVRHLELSGRGKIAPARTWPASRVRLMYLDFFSAHGVLDCAGTQFRSLMGRGFHETMEGMGLMARACANALRLRLGNAA